MSISPRFIYFACAGLLAATWLDVLDLLETLTLLQRPGYAEANLVLTSAGLVTLDAIKLLVPVLIGLLLLVLYRRSATLFRLATAALWLCIPFYTAVVTHNLLLLLSR